MYSLAAAAMALEFSATKAETAKRRSHALGRSACMASVEAAATPLFIIVALQPLSLQNFVSNVLCKTIW